MKIPKIPAPKKPEKSAEYIRFDAHCHKCVNFKWCSKYFVIALLHSPSTESCHIVEDFPCNVFSCKNFIANCVIIGYCDKTCHYRYYDCPFCPKNNYAKCKKHLIYYNTLKYFKGNGVCCACLKVYMFKEKVKNGKVFMVKEVKGNDKSKGA